MSTPNWQQNPTTTTPTQPQPLTLEDKSYLYQLLPLRIWPPAAQHNGDHLRPNKEYTFLQYLQAFITQFTSIYTKLLALN